MTDLDKINKAPQPDSKEAEASKAKEHADALKDNEAKAKVRKDVLDAVNKLEHENDGDWGKDGKPSLERIQQLVGDNRVSQELLDEIAGDLERVSKVIQVKTGEKLVKTEKDHPDYVENVKVIAIRNGQYGGKIRREGDTFFVTGILRGFMKRVK